MTDRGPTYSEAWRAECESRYWLAKVRERGPRNAAEGRAMLDEILAPIAKRRGPQAADDLRNRIEALRTKTLDETRRRA